jgi:hypothetical protein
MVLKRRILAIAGFLGIMVVLGVFVNTLFLAVALASLCGITHLLGGHHGGAGHEHDMVHEEKDTEPSASGS